MKHKSYHSKWRDNNLRIGDLIFKKNQQEAEKLQRVSTTKNYLLNIKIIKLKI